MIDIKKSSSFMIGSIMLLTSWATNGCTRYGQQPSSEELLARPENALDLCLKCNRMAWMSSFEPQTAQQAEDQRKYLKFRAENCGAFPGRERDAYVAPGTENDPGTFGECKECLKDKRAVPQKLTKERQQASDKEHAEKVKSYNAWMKARDLENEKKAQFWNNRKFYKTKDY